MNRRERASPSVTRLSPVHNCVPISATTCMMNMNTHPPATNDPFKQPDVFTLAYSDGRVRLGQNEYSRCLHTTASTIWISKHQGCVFVPTITKDTT